MRYAVIVVCMPLHDDPSIPLVIPKLMLMRIACTHAHAYETYTAPLNTTRPLERGVRGASPAVLILRHHALGVGDKVGGVVAALKLHALHKHEVVLRRLALLHGHHALAAHLQGE